MRVIVTLYRLNYRKQTALELNISLASNRLSHGLRSADEANDARYCHLSAGLCIDIRDAGNMIMHATLGRHCENLLDLKE